MENVLVFVLSEICRSFPIDKNST